jgi:hypothetical protein
MSRFTTHSAAGAAAVLAAFVLGGCGGSGSVAQSAASLTKKAMNAHDTKYTSIQCVQPSQEHFVCQAVGSSTTPGYFAWCSVPVEGEAIGSFDAQTDCHWPSVRTAPHITRPNNPVLTTPSRLG